MADSQDTRTLPLPRRSLLTASTTALAAPPLPATPADPTLPLYEAWATELRITESLAKAYNLDPDPDADDSHLIAAEIRCDQAAERLLATRPTTLPGLAVKALCIRSRLERPHDEMLLEIITDDLKYLADFAPS
ncbi:hypothetical protein [Azospirillum sp. sgz301742]